MQEVQYFARERYYISYSNVGRGKNLGPLFQGALRKTERDGEIQTASVAECFLVFFFVCVCSVECRKRSRVTVFWFIWLCGWSRKLASSFKLIRRKTKANRELITSISRAFGGMLIFTLSSHWLTMILTFVMIGRCDNFCFRLFTFS